MLMHKWRATANILQLTVVMMRVSSEVWEEGDTTERRDPILAAFKDKSLGGYLLWLVCRFMLLAPWHQSAQGIFRANWLSPLGSEALSQCVGRNCIE